MMKRTLLAILMAGTVLLGGSKAAAQQKLTEQQQEQFKQRIIDVVNDFNGRVSEIWRQPNRVEKQDMQRFRDAKQYEVEAALRLFVGDGKEYDETEVEEVWNGTEYVQQEATRRHRAVQMETSSVNNKRKFRQTVESYLKKAANAVGGRIEVTACDAYFASDLKQVAPGRYEATVSYVQDFLRFNADGGKVYGDRTTKTIRVYLILEERAGEKVWFVRLGDIMANNTERL